MTEIEKPEKLGNCIMVHLAKHATNKKPQINALISETLQMGYSTSDKGEKITESL